MKVAIVFKGGISKKIGNLLNPNEINTNSEFINYHCAYNSFKKHIIDANPNHEIDTFIHCWHPELEEELFSLYKPTQIVTENNARYNANILYKLAMSYCPKSCFSVVSQVLSLKKVCEMAAKYCTERNFKYDLVLIYRLDLLLIEDMIFEDYDLNSITCNNWAELKGDFHFVMNYENMLKFSKMYDNFSPSYRPIAHQYAKQYVQQILKIPYAQDNIAAGRDQEVVRKAIIFVRDFNRPFEKLEKYGITKDEILSYNL
jgi:hypothetical protein